MRNYSIDLPRVPKQLQPGLRAIIAEYPHRFGDDKSTTPVRFEHVAKPAEGNSHLSVTKGDTFVVRYHRPTDAFRALGRLLGESPNNKTDFTEAAWLDLAGMMIDVSRNGVVLPSVLRQLLVRYALMGLNMAILYAEDVYEVPGEPFFGYLRGRYTQDDLRALDQFAFDLGIEMFPCIQTLGHFAQILQWPAYKELTDTEQIIIAEGEKTYALLEKIIAAACSPFRSKRIHLGMDEAHGMGYGGYLKKHPPKAPFDIFTDHLNRVRAICQKHDLQPMIWSDMYFRLGSKTHAYYDTTAAVPPEVVKRIPKDVQLVYWDYYHLDPDFYADFIQRHRALGSEPLVASGIWSWHHFWTALPYSFRTTDACMNGCRKAKVREVFTTCWGDGGTEGDIFSTLPALQHFAEHVYSQKEAVDPSLRKANFRGSCDAHFDDWVAACAIDDVPGFTDPMAASSNVSKWMLYQDPMLAIMSPNLKDLDLAEHFEKTATKLRKLARKGETAQRLRFPAAMAAVLSRIAHLRRQMEQAYRAGDKQALLQLIQTHIKPAEKRVRELWKTHRAMWMQTYKAFGWEVLDRRYGGFMTRLASTAARLEDYAEGRIDAIPELEEEILPVVHFSNDTMNNVTGLRVFSPSFIK